MKTHGVHVTKNHVSIGRILFELGGKTLFDEINERDITEKEALTILRDVGLALHELHSIGIYHLDVKPENIIMVGNSYKLCDFGSVLTKTVDYDSICQDEKDDILEYITYNST
jgi:serine/threonine protein kinase